MQFACERIYNYNYIHCHIDFGLQISFPSFIHSLGRNSAISEVGIAALREAKKNKDECKTKYVSISADTPLRLLLII